MHKMGLHIVSLILCQFSAILRLLGPIQKGTATAVSRVGVVAAVEQF